MLLTSSNLFSLLSFRIYVDTLLTASLKQIFLFSNSMSRETPNAFASGTSNEPSGKFSLHSHFETACEET